MSSLVIVAIPNENDYVWNLSSEKVPHMTMLYLGDVEGAPVLKIQQFLEHAVSILELGPFGLEVDYRGTLGLDNADVLFFKDNYSLKRIAEFRGQLLKDPSIWKQYNSVPQIDGPWLPHLTMGYPGAPAKKDTRDYPGITWVEFDRIALWYGDYEGPEFRLEYRDTYSEMAMSTQAQVGSEFLTHFGVKGMHWGVRKAPPAAVAVKVESVVKNPKAAKTKINAEGGHNHPATEDALRVAAANQKLKKSGIHTLTNKELQDVATRMNLEQQVTNLHSKRPRSIGQKFVDEQLNKAQRDPIKTITQLHKHTKTALSFVS